MNPDQPAPAITLNWPEPPPGYKLLCQYVSLREATSARMFFPRDGWADEKIHYPSLKASYIDSYWLAVKETDEHGTPLANDAGETPRVDAIYEKWPTSAEFEEREADLRRLCEDLEREAAMLRREWDRIKGEMDRDEHVIQARKGHNEAALRASASERESAALREELTAVRPYADCYKRVCESLGIEDNILSYVRSLQAALADGKGEGT